MRIIAIIKNSNTDNVDDNDNNGIDNDDGNLRNERKYESKELGGGKQNKRASYFSARK